MPIMMCIISVGSILIAFYLQSRYDCDCDKDVNSETKEKVETIANEQLVADTTKIELVK